MRLTGLTLKVLLPQLTSDPASAERLRRTRPGDLDS
jgi:hypothetical protein